MGAWLLAHEAALRLSGFFGLFVLLAVLQAARPLRGVSGVWGRFGRHLLLALLGSLLVRLVFPWLAVAAGALAQARGYGLLPWLGLPEPAQLLAGILLLDFAIYWQHRIFHRLPWLWRLHRVHHSDTQFEVSTAIRFHPLEIALSMAIKIGCVLALGVPAVAALLFEILLSATALFSHTDVRLPARIDATLRWWLVTPAMHRIHHSPLPQETDSNYGFCLPWWDRVFGSYRAQPTGDERRMPIGLDRFRESREQRLSALLAQPLR